MTIENLFVSEETTPEGDSTSEEKDTEGGNDEGGNDEVDRSDVGTTA